MAPLPPLIAAETDCAPTADARCPGSANSQRAQGAPLRARFFAIVRPFADPSAANASARAHFAQSVASRLSAKLAEILQPKERESCWQRKDENRPAAWHPPGCGRFAATDSGGGAALAPRLMAAIPPGA